MKQACFLTPMESLMPESMHMHISTPRLSIGAKRHACFTLLKVTYHKKAHILNGQVSVYIF